MFLKSVTVLLALTASLGNAAPSPTLPDKLLGSRTEAELSKRTDHIGLGTVFLQEGGTGSCGQKNPDSSFIVAISNFWMLGKSPGPFCGRKIKATNIGSNDGVGGKGNTVIVKVKDTCPSCDKNHLDFSVGAWNALTNNAPFGTVNINWHFCNVSGQC